jgi:hypothetical protein
VQAGKHGREQVVDDERDRVREVEEVRERPDPRMRDRGRATCRRLDERAQPAGGGDAAREDEPDRERSGEDDERECDDEAGRGVPITCDAGQEREERERPADRRDRESEQEVSREAGASRLVGARPRDGSAPAASGVDAGNLEHKRGLPHVHALHTRSPADRFSGGG